MDLKMLGNNMLHIKIVNITKSGKYKHNGFSFLPGSNMHITLILSYIWFVMSKINQYFKTFYTVLWPEFQIFLLFFFYSSSHYLHHLHNSYTFTQIYNRNSYIMNSEQYVSIHFIQITSS